MRNRALDGIRGLLALVVFIRHCLPDSPITGHAADLAIMGFFVLSGLVLTRSGVGNYPRFLARRFVRLWPMYALTLTAGYILGGQSIVWADYIWVPPHPMAVNLPAWSLCVEAAAMVVFPIFSRHGLSLAFCALAMAVQPLYGLFALCFTVGAWLANTNLRSRILESAIPQYLGRVSYPLYLSHWLVLTYSPAPLWVNIGIAFGVAHLLTITVERWSIEASRAVGMVPKRA